ncbi:MAG TPA: hypothetical protein VF111_05535, partial [Thermoanaerobaculia bacterium]
MRIHAAVVVLILTLVSTSQLTGQQEALPAVRARATSADATSLPATPVSAIVREEPTVIMPLVPLAENMAEPTLAETAQNRDYGAFQSRYILARARGEQVAQYDALYELWSWSMSSPTGAFYGPELHDRIAAAYPGFAGYIDEHKIVDQNGNVFYPTAETRTFLLEQALRNTRAPRVQIAGTEAPRRATPTTTGIAPLAPSRSRSRARMQKADATTTKPVTTKPITKPVAKPAPVQVATSSSSVPRSSSEFLGDVAAAPPKAQLPATPRNRGTEELRGTEQPQPATLATMTPQPVKPLATQPALPQPASRTGGRAVLMIIIGLLGAGILAVLLRAPKEEPVTVLPPIEPKGEVGKVEPIRK